MARSFLFTSESVTEGHPDKVADQISDSILDAILAQDKYARVACETLVTTGLAMIAGEITTTARIDYPDIVRQTIKEIGYNDSSMGFDWETCAVLTSVDRQSPDIAQGVEGRGLSPEQGAGDQGLMFGYASTSTENLMPMPIWYAHRLAERLAKVRKNGTLPWLRPDGKTQVTVRYENGEPKSIHTVVIAAQHNPEVKYEDLEEAIIEEVIKKTIPADLLVDTKFLINTTGRFRGGRPPGRLRHDRPQDHRRHLRRPGLPRRRRLLRQGPHQGGPHHFLHAAPRGQKRGGRRPGQALRGPGGLFHRPARPPFHHGLHLRHRGHL